MARLGGNRRGILQPERLTTIEEGLCGCPLRRREPGDGREPPAIRATRRMAAQAAGTYDPRKNDDRYHLDI